MKNIKQVIISLILTFTLTACATNTQKKQYINSSYLKESKDTQLNIDNKGVSSNIEIKDAKLKTLEYLPPLKTESKRDNNVNDLTTKFSSNDLVQIAVDELALTDYLHYVLGELLEVSYIPGETVKADSKTITLNIQKPISKRKLFSLSEELLSERGYVIRFEDGIYYIHKADSTGSQGEITYGYGSHVDNVPNTSLDIIQLVPFTFGMQTSISNTLRGIVKIKATPDFQRNAIILQGKRKNILRALEFINLMDQPVFKNRHIGSYKATYVDTATLIDKLPGLLKQEGITVSAKGQNDQAVSLISLERIGTLILFANSKELINRVGFWSQQIDKPSKANKLEYFIYHPQFARATDLGESLQVLIGGKSNLGNSTSAASQNKNKSSSTKGNSISATTEDLSLVVDERTNALIFKATGDKYRQLYPLIQRLDVMPRQVLLEVVIAEVKLSDTFKQGVDFVLTNQGGASTVGGFNLSSGSKGLTYLLSGSDGSLTLNLLRTNSNVNVLSRPSLLVRDGVTASITVGDDIPTVGEIITDPTNGSKTSVVYRKTGVELGVKPTINAQGVVIMEIDQKISNQATGDDSVAGSPIIFERSIRTEVVAKSGQTIILGGLISENSSVSDTSVPFFSSIPIIGSLFNSTNDTGDKTELVVMVTPRVIESVDEWEAIVEKFSSGFNNLKLNQ